MASGGSARWVCLCGLFLAWTAHPAAADVRPDEDIVFFNSSGFFDEQANHWVIRVHGWIFERELDSIRRGALLAAFREALDLDDDPADEMVFNRRAMLFLTDNERGKRVTLRAGDQGVTIGPSERNGHLRGTLRLPAEQADRLARPDAFGRRWIELPVVLSESDPRRFVARVLLIEPVGLSVISDIDDTIKVTQITDREAMLRNTFLRPYQSVTGMAELYRRWAGRGAVFHYVSASPWQLYEPLTNFMAAAGFPAGSLHLKTFYWKDSRFLSLFEDPMEYKPAVIEPILREFPRRQFVLVGDSGEKDPEVYAALVRKYPRQVLHVFIRAIAGETPEAARFRTAFEGLPREIWTVFAGVADLEGANLPDMLRLPPATTTAPAKAPTAP